MFKIWDEVIIKESGKHGFISGITHNINDVNDKSYVVNKVFYKENELELYQEVTEEE